VLEKAIGARKCVVRLETQLDVVLLGQPVIAKEWEFN